MQAAPGGQQGTVAIGFNPAAFQRKVDALARGIAEYALRGQALDQQVIQAGFELAAPGGEAEVQHVEAVAGAQCDGPGIAQPGVVVGHGYEPHLRHVHPVGAQADVGIGFDVVVGHADHHRLEAGDGLDQGDVGVLDIAQAVGPVGAGMRPRDQDRRLGFPLGGEAHVVLHAGS